MDAQDIVEHFEYLRRFARSRARDEELAEEAVQEALLAALESRERFGGRAKLRTWLTGILLHKIHDGFRRRSRELTVREGDLDEDLADYLLAGGGLPDCVTPERALQNRELRAAIDRALSKLPPRQKDAFLLQEVAALDPAHSRRLLGVGAGNLWVLVHRAKAHLRESLAREGFSPA